MNCQVSGFQEGTLLDGTMKPGQWHRPHQVRHRSQRRFPQLTVANCTFRDCRGLALEEVDGGIMENISINNITMMDVVGYPIYITTGKRNRGPDVTSPSRAANIFISNVIATGIDPMSGIQLDGMPKEPLENIRLENIHLLFKGGGTKSDAVLLPRELDTDYPEPSRLGTMPAYGLYARHVRGLELANITVGVEKLDSRPPLACFDVDGLEIDNFKAQLLRGVPPAKFVVVDDVVIRNSPIFDSMTDNTPAQ